MEDDLALGLCIIKVLCLIVIAMGVHKVAYANEYMWSPPSALNLQDQSQNSLHSYQASGFDNAEPPVFWNLGSVEAVDKELHAAAAMGVDSSTYGVAGQSAHQVASGFRGGRSFATGGPLEHKLNPY